jgi:hypothetical protein
MAADAVAGQTELAEFGILGPLEVSRAGRAVPLGGPRQRAVLALLLLEANRVVSLDRLAEDIWGGRPPDGWATTVQIYVSHLRRAQVAEDFWVHRGLLGGVARSIGVVCLLPAAAPVTRLIHIPPPVGFRGIDALRSGRPPPGGSRPP